MHLFSITSLLQVHYTIAVPESILSAPLKPPRLDRLVMHSNNSNPLDVLLTHYSNADKVNHVSIDLLSTTNQYRKQ